MEREVSLGIFNLEISRMPNSRPKRHKVRSEDFSATIDYVIFIIRGFPLYTYSMVVANQIEYISIGFLVKSLLFKGALFLIQILFGEIYIRKNHQIKIVY